MSLTSGAPITLKQGVLLGKSEVLYLASLKDSPPRPVPGVSAQSPDANHSDVVAQLIPHVRDLDYLTANLLYLNCWLSTDRQLPYPENHLG